LRFDRLLAAKALVFREIHPSEKLYKSGVFAKADGCQFQVIGSTDTPEHCVGRPLIDCSLHPVERHREISNSKISQSNAKRIFDSIFLNTPVDSFCDTLQEFVLVSD